MTGNKGAKMLQKEVMVSRSNVHLGGCPNPLLLTGVCTQMGYEHFCKVTQACEVLYSLTLQPHHVSFLFFHCTLTREIK